MENNSTANSDQKPWYKKWWVWVIFFFVIGYYLPDEDNLNYASEQENVATGFYGQYIYQGPDTQYKIRANGEKFSGEVTDFLGQIILIMSGTIREDHLIFERSNFKGVIDEYAIEIFMKTPMGPHSITLIKE